MPSDSGDGRESATCAGDAGGLTAQGASDAVRSLPGFGTRRPFPEQSMSFHFQVYRHWQSRRPLHWSLHQLLSRAAKGGNRTQHSKTTACLGA